jgi:hypothetical protein
MTFPRIGAFFVGVVVAMILSTTVEGQDYKYDTNGNPIMAIGGDALTSLQLTDNIVSVEDAPAGSGWSGVGALAVRQSVHADLAADGDFIPLTVDDDGGLRVTIVAGAGSGGTALADDGDFTAGTTNMTVAGGFYQSSVTACTDGDACAVGITAQRTLKVTLFSAAGAELTPSSDVTEDAPETAGGTGPLVLGVRRDTAASSAGTTGDNATINTDALGRLWTRRGDPCGDHARVTLKAISQATAGNNDELVGEVASNVVYVCGLVLVADGAVEAQLISGTGTDCGTSETDLSGPMSLAANGGFVVPNTGATQFGTTSGHDLCLELSGAVEVNGWLSYVQTAAP